MRSLAATILIIAFLAGCRGGPKGESGGPFTSFKRPAGQMPQSQTGENGGPHLTPAPALTEEEVKAQAHKLALDAIDLLDQGREDEAKVLLNQAIALSPAEKIAASMQRQIAADPVAMLGARSFRYTVRSGETLSSIARRFMGDMYAFYILARYNDIRVPNDVHAGQVIKVPGEAPPEPRRSSRTEAPLPESEAPPAAPPPAPPPAQGPNPAEIAYQKGLQLLKAGKKDQAYWAFRQALKLDPDSTTARAQTEQLKQDLIRLHTRLAMAAYYRQDMATAIKEWDQVLEIDPGNESAALWRGKAIEVQKKAAQLPKR